MTTTIERRVTTTTDPDRVFAYLADFRNAKQWDSGTTSCELVSGDGGPGTVYRNVSAFAGTTVGRSSTIICRDSVGSRSSW